MKEMYHTGQQSTSMISLLLRLNLTQGGDAAAYSVVSSVAALADGSVVLAGRTSGEITATIANAGGLDFAVIKLSEAGVQEWAWQVRLKDQSNTNKEEYHT